MTVRFASYKIGVASTPVKTLESLELYQISHFENFGSAFAKRISSLIIKADLSITQVKIALANNL